MFDNASALPSAKVKTGPARIGPISASDPLAADLGIDGLLAELSSDLGRPVNIMLFPSLNEAFRRPSLFFGRQGSTVETRNSWRTLLLSMTNASKKRVLLEWIIKDGTCFKMHLPSEEEFAENTFRASLEFPYVFNDIEEVKVVQTIAEFELTAEEILALEEIANHLNVFQCTRWPDGGLTIRMRVTAH